MLQTKQNESRITVVSDYISTARKEILIKSCPCKINAKKTNAPQALRINKTNRPTYGEFNDEQKALVRAYYQNFPGVNFKLIDPEYNG